LSLLLSFKKHFEGKKGNFFMLSQGKKSGEEEKKGEKKRGRKRKGRREEGRKEEKKRKERKKERRKREREKGEEKKEGKDATPRLNQPGRAYITGDPSMT
jgi:hypothetical protein